MQLRIFICVRALALLSLDGQQVCHNGDHVLLLVQVDGLEEVARLQAPLGARIEPCINVLHLQERHFAGVDFGTHARLDVVRRLALCGLQLNTKTKTNNKKKPNSSLHEPAACRR